jgi:diguanylate cyclase (GGDEF)-like protein
VTAAAPRTSVKLWAFCLCYLGAGVIVALFAAGLESPAGQPFQLHWLLLVGGFVLAERLVVDLEVRREAHTLTFTEVVMTLGLVFAAPVELVFARVLASAVAVAVFRRPAPVKLVFNSGLFALDAGVSLLVYHALLGGGSPVDPMGWIAAMVAIAVAHLLNALGVSFVMRVAGAPVTLRDQGMVIGVSLVAALAGTAVALAASGVLWQEGHSWVLLVLVGSALGYFFISFVRIRERHQGLATLHSFTTALGARSDTPSLAKAVVMGMADLLRASRVVLLLPVNGSLMRTEYRQGSVEVERDHFAGDLEWMTALSLAGHQRLLKDGARNVAGVVVANSTAITATLPMADQSGLIVVDGRLSSTRPFDDEDVRLLETAAGHAASAFQNVALVDELREEATVRARQALHDDITDLPNSRGLAETLQLPLLMGTSVALLTIRLDSLREVNETLGRAMGDELLIQAAARLAPLAEDGWCAKTASDEFTLAVRGGNDAAEAMAAQVIDAFEAPVQCEDVALAVTAGIGVVLAPDHGRETEILLRRGSLAASRSRVEGTRVTVWAADRDPYDPQRLAIAADLRDAIPAGELQVHFQPQVDIDSGLVIAAEALVRWRHPRLGELRPDQFIAAAEYTGAIDALTEFVLSSAARTCAGWRAQGWDLDVSVNLSARNLANLAFAGTVQRVLEETGLEPSALTLELTESSIMTEAAEAMVTLDAIHGLGVSLSIDDFGTGYSSLAHLRKLPVSEIKIDKSFVFDLTTNPNDEAIVRSMVSLGHHLGLTVVVEGVETVEVRRRLAELGADRIQGYLLSRPMPVAAFEQWIADRPVRMANLAADDADVDAPERADDRER